MGWEEELGHALESAARNAPDRVGVMFSGGLDSSLLAFLLDRANKKVHLYSSCTAKSHDGLWAQKAADILGLPIDLLLQNNNEIIDGMRNIKSITGEKSSMLLLIELPLYFISRDSKDSTLVTGQGADELFLGYKKYGDADTSGEDLRRLMNYVVPLESRISGIYGKGLLYPYLDKRVAEIALKIPYEQKVQNGIRKKILRTVASRMGLPDEIAWKEKKASQYSSGFKDAVSNMAKMRKETVHEFINEL